MSTKKKTAKKRRLKKTETVIIIESTFDPKDTLFPEKVARAKEMLSKTDFNGYL
jgi:hypothetical protein